MVGIPGRVIHQSGVRVNPLAHSALPDAEANVIRNLMERIDELESTVGNLQRCLQEVAAGRQLRDICRGEAQSLKGPRNSRVPRRRRMIIDHSLGLVFLHVPKCAGTALRNAWQDAADGRDVVSFFDFGFDPVLQRQVDLAHQPLMDLRHRREWRFLRRYHVVACIRHPYQRLASACREY